MTAAGASSERRVTWEAPQYPVMAESGIMKTYSQFFKILSSQVQQCVPVSLGRLRWEDLKFRQPGLYGKLVWTTD